MHLLTRHYLAVVALRVEIIEDLVKDNSEAAVSHLQIPWIVLCAKVSNHRRDHTGEDGVPDPFRKPIDTP